MTKQATHFRNVLTLSSRFRYALWRLTGGKRTIDLQLVNGPCLRMRSLETTDYGIAWQIFLRDDYESPIPVENVQRIVDLGANVGYSCLYWCHRYPQSQVTAFEPHPRHLKAIEENLALNKVLDRVNVIGAAAGSNERTSYLTDARASSAVTDKPADFEIRVVDIFREPAMQGRIDILKMDIEGAEYEILSDPRFQQLDIRVLVLEWHNTPEYPDGLTWCLENLRGRGYQTRLGAEDPPLAGLVWAYR